MMKHLCLSAALATCALPVLAQDPALTAEEFDRLTQGKTMDTYDRDSGLYGVESFLSGHRVIWKDAEGCMHGTWEQVGEQICFTYDSGSNNPVCWTYHDRGGWMMGWFRGDRQTVPIMLQPSTAGPVSCEGYMGV